MSLAISNDIKTQQNSAIRELSHDDSSTKSRYKLTHISYMKKIPPYPGEGGLVE